MDEKLRLAYATAMKAQHECGSVQIHVGTKVRDYLRSLVTVPDAHRVLDIDQRMWGFPCVVDERAWPESITVHVVQVIA